MEMQAVSTLETHLIESCHEEGGHCLKQAQLEECETLFLDVLHSV